MSDFIKSKENLANAFAKLDSSIEAAIKRAFEQGKKQAGKPKTASAERKEFEAQIKDLQRENAELKTKIEQLDQVKIDVQSNITKSIEQLDALIENRK